MSRVQSICQALAEETLLRHASFAMDKILKIVPTPEVDALLQAARDNKQDALAERFITWAKEEGLNLELNLSGRAYESDSTEYAWRAVKAFCL
jgi:hypothetical protein